MNTMPNLSQQIVDEIRSRGLTPVPRWHFLVRRSALWTFAIASVILGAISLAVGQYVFFDNEGLSPRILLESPLMTVLQVIPIVWIAGFALFAASAYHSLRRTRSGYRYRTTAAVLGVIVCTALLSGILVHFDFGSTVHDYLLSNTPFYDSLIHSSDDEANATPSSERN